MKEKDMYTFDELLDNLKIPISELCRRAYVTEGTIARIKKGFPTRRSTANKLLGVLSNLYERELSLDNVKGLDLERRQSADKPARPPGNISLTNDLSAIGVSQNRIVERKGKVRSEIPSDLPDGTIRLIDFIEKHELPESSTSYYISKGFRGEKIETTQKARPSGSGSQHFLTPEQQEKALEFLIRHGKLKTSQPKQEQPIEEERLWHAPDGE